MSKNITQQRDIYDTVIFRFLQISILTDSWIYMYMLRFPYWGDGGSSPHQPKMILIDVKYS